MSEAEGDFRDQSRRSVLEGLRSANDRTDSAASDNSAAAGGPILLGRFVSAASVKKLRNRLAAENITTTKEVSRGELCVYVHRRRRERAFAILDEHLREHPNRKPKGLNRVWDILVLTALLGTLNAAIVTLAWKSVLVGVASWLTVVSYGLLVSLCLRYQRINGSLQFSIRTWLVVIAWTAALIAFWRIAVQTL